MEKILIIDDDENTARFIDDLAKEGVKGFFMPGPPAET